jgi:hypothetical protein
MYLLKIHFNIIIPSTSRSSKWSLALSFPNKNPVYIPFPLCITYYWIKFHLFENQSSWKQQCRSSAFDL